MSKRGRVPLYIYALIFFSFTDIYIISGVKLVYIFTVLLIPAIIKRVIVINRKDTYLILWYLSYFLSVNHIISQKDFIAVTIGQLILFVIYFHFSSITNYDKLKKYINLIQISLSILVLIGVVQLSLYYLIGSTWGISHVTHGVGLPRMSGLSSEPDWYGVICMMCLICFLVNILNNQVVIGPVLDKTICIFSIAMMILSLTRAAWVGFAVAGLVFLLMINDIKTKLMKNRLFKYILMLIPIALVTLLFLYISGNNIFLKIMQRMNVFQWASNDGGAMGTRLSAISIMLHYFKTHPLTGNGVGSMAYISQDRALLNSLGYYYEVNAGRGSANLFVTNLFDVGVFGTLFLTIFIVRQIKSLYVSYKKYGDKNILITLLLAIALLVDFQFNNGIRQPYVWFVLGISNSLMRLNFRREPNK